MDDSMVKMCPDEYVVRVVGIVPDEHSEVEDYVFHKSDCQSTRVREEGRVNVDDRE